MSVRAYDPTVGRFLARDPLGRAPLFFSDQPYAYAVLADMVGFFCQRIKLTPSSYLSLRCTNTMLSLCYALGNAQSRALMNRRDSRWSGVTEETGKRESHPHAGSGV